MKKHNIIFLCIGIECLLILSIAIAASFGGGVGFAVFYNMIYGLILSTILPFYLVMKNNEGLSSVGIKRLGNRQIIIILSFVILSIGGQVISKGIAGANIEWNKLRICILPLIMTTFFEEFLFRGFFQTRIEKKYGSVMEILISGTMFSLYHLGYPGFRTAEDILLLLAVGAGFSIAFKLSYNNLIVSYLINLPNAFLTYILKSKQFPAFTKTSSIYAGLSITLIVIVFLYGRRRLIKETS
jgi:uncharacterized protein